MIAARATGAHMTGVRALVVGGGFAGVAAAARLRTLGAAVTLVDERPALGGRARSDVLEGTTIDIGAQLIASSFARTVRLLAPPLRQTPSRDVLVHAGARHPIQFGSVASLLGFGGLGALEKLKLGTSVLPLLARYRARLDAAAEETPASLDREAARAYVERHVGAHAADAIVEPALNAACAGRGREVSLAMYLTMGRYGSEGRMLAPAAGWSAALAGALAGVEREHGVRVAALAFPPSGGVRAYGADGHEWEADVAVVATGAGPARTLLAPHGPAAPIAEWLARVETRPTWTLALALDAPAGRDAFGVLRLASEARAVIACAVHGAKLGDSARADGDVVLAWPTPDALERLKGRAAGEIVAAMMPEVEQLVPSVRGRVVRARVYRFDDGVPIARPGFVADRARGRALADAMPLPVALAGDYLTTPMLEGAVASGQRAAEILVARLAA